jgi:heat-inducible transcriptional repressor
MSIKDEILRSVVIHYIGDATPIGSVQLQKEYAMNISSATIRNHFKKLVLEGLLEQLHTSSGRIPTNEALIAYWNIELKTNRPVRIHSLERVAEAAERFDIYASLCSDSQNRLEGVESHREEYLILRFASRAVLIPYSRAVERFLGEFGGMELGDLVNLSREIGISDLTRNLLNFIKEQNMVRFNKNALIEIAHNNPRWSERYFERYFDGEAAFWLKEGVNTGETVPSHCLAGRLRCLMGEKEFLLTFVGEASRDFRNFLSSL